MGGGCGRRIGMIKKDFPKTRIISAKANCNRDGSTRSETITKARSAGSIRGVWMVKSRNNIEQVGHMSEGKSGGAVHR